MPEKNCSIAVSTQSLPLYVSKLYKNLWFIIGHFSVLYHEWRVGLRWVNMCGCATLAWGNTSQCSDFNMWRHLGHCTSANAVLICFDACVNRIWIQNGLFNREPQQQRESYNTIRKPLWYRTSEWRKRSLLPAQSVRTPPPASQQRQKPPYTPPPIQLHQINIHEGKSFCLYLPAHHMSWNSR